MENDPEPVTHFRTFLNSDPPALDALWNRALSAPATARPLSGHEFDLHVVCKPHFQADGLIVAERDRKIVGFAHAGFGPEEPIESPQALNHALGTIGMLVVEAGTD